jgi:hypothetical protein
MRSFVMFILHKACYSDKIKEGEMGGECSVQWRCEKFI